MMASVDGRVPVGRSPARRLDPTRYGVLEIRLTALGERLWGAASQLKSLRRRPDSTQVTSQSARRETDHPDRVVRVMVVDDHPIVAESLIAILERDRTVEVVTRASCVADCLARYPATRPDVVILDRNLPDGDGIDAAERILTDDPDARILILSAEADGPAVRRAVELGCAGYLLKTAHPDELRKAVSEVAAGRTVLPPELAAQLADAMRAGQRRAQTTLSVRESEVLTLLCQGNDPATIAERLVMSPLTVKTHLGRLYRKLDVHDRAAAVAKAFRDGLVEV